MTGKVGTLRAASSLFIALARFVIALGRSLLLDVYVHRLSFNGELGTVKQVLFCGFQRQRKPTLAERKICVFCGFCVNIIPTLALRLLFPHTEI